MNKTSLHAVNLFAAFVISSVIPAHALPGC
jgi:hypothetical protein